MDLKDAAAYIISRVGCATPFFISRVLVLVNWLSEERFGSPLVSFRVAGFSAGFYIEGLKEGLFSDECFVRREEKKCIEYVCGLPALPERARILINEVLERVRGLSEVELNRLVIKDPRYTALLERGGW